MFVVLKNEIIKSVLNVLGSIAFRWRVIKNGGYASKSLIVANQRYIHIGKRVRIKKYYRIECYPWFAGEKLNPNIVFEDGVIIGPCLTIFCANTIKIGKDTIFAGNVTLISENHGTDPDSDIPYHAQPLSTGPIFIGEGCWFGHNVSVLPNVSIGKKCIIATNSVVTHSIPDYSIAAGVPAKVIKQYNFSTHSWDLLNKA